MNLQALISTFRQLAGDRAFPPLFSDEQVTEWLNEAEREAAERAKLLHERTRTDIVRVPLVVGQREYDLNPVFIDTDGDTMYVQRTTDSQRTRAVMRQTQADIEWVIANRANLTGWPDGFFIYSDGQGATARRLVLDRKPAEAGGYFWLSGYRYPLSPMTASDDEPEIHQRHHMHLIDWVLFRAFNTRDLEGSSEARSAKHLGMFTDHFGGKSDANVQRKRYRHRASVVRPIGF